MSLIVGLE
uniref:Uncharacterized protein n=1 Tax=Arundo donax TaxID=35708 RepID=A0A0A9GW13_ARUDO